MLDLNSLIGQLPTITEKMGGYLAEAAAYCLEYNNHKSGLALRVSGSDPEVTRVVWSFELDDRVEDTYQDKAEVTEYGATGIAILLSLERTEHQTVQRSVKGTGFDYWIGDHDPALELPFQRKARLEVSGILTGDSKSFRSRISKKRKQTDVSDYMKLPAFISVVEFSEPIASFIEK